MRDAYNWFELVKVIHNHLTFDRGMVILGLSPADRDWWLAGKSPSKQCLSP